MRIWMFFLEGTAVLGFQMSKDRWRELVGCCWLCFDFCIRILPLRTMKTNFQNFSCVRNESMYRTMRQIQFEKNSLIRRRTNQSQSFSILRPHLDSTSAQVSILGSKGNSTHSKVSHSGRSSQGLQLGKGSQPERLRVKKRGINWDVLNEHLRLPKFDRWEKKLIDKLGKTTEVDRIFSLLN